MARIISIVNQKGGVGKTTTAINLGHGLNLLGKDVLLVDLDPQANATSGLGLRQPGIQRGIYDTIARDLDLASIIQATPYYGFHVAPSTVDLAGANIELVNLPRREYRLADAVVEAHRDYDYILIDCPPSLGLLTLNGIVASDEVLIPVQTEYYALEGLGQLLETVELIKKNLKPDINVLGAVMTMFDPRYRLTHDVMMELYKFFPNKIFRSVIPRNIHLAEAPSHGKPVAAYQPRSRAAKAYHKLARELIDTEHPHHAMKQKAHEQPAL